MQKLYIVRHGLTDWNAQGLTQGTTDILLNEEGIEQAKEIAKEIDLSKIDLCICSPLLRAKETAQIIVQDKVPIIFDDLLVERNFGLYEGKKIGLDLIFQHWNYKLNDKEGNIESIQECLSRAQMFLNKIKENYPDKNILIVAHGCIIKAIHFNIMGYTENTDFLSFNPQNAIIYNYVL